MVPCATTLALSLALLLARPTFGEFLDSVFIPLVLFSSP